MTKKVKSYTREYNSLLKRALQNPRVKDVAQMYDNYHDILKTINGITANIKPGSATTTSNSAS